MLWLLVASLLQTATQTPTSLPQCRGVSLSVESVRPAEYEFRLTIRNHSPKAVVLFNFSFLHWDLSRKTPRGWQRSVSGAGALGTFGRSDEAFDPVDPQRRIPDVEIDAGATYVRTLSNPALWGDEATDHPGALYRVTFALTPEPPNRASPPLCRLYAKPVVFQEASPAKRREYWRNKVPK